MSGNSFDLEIIKARIPAEIASVQVYDVTDSTNTRARHYATFGGAAPSVFIADSQTAGRGRTGKSFYSPTCTGLYLSLLLPRCPQSDFLYMTSVAAVAVRRAIATVTGIETEIKWVNDLYIKDKKVSGILCEAFSVGERSFVIVGVGINISTEGFPEELREVACSLGLPSDKNMRDLLAAECVSELYGVWQNDATEELFAEYRKFSMVLGRSVRYTENGVLRNGTAIDIDEKGRLHVKDVDGTVRILDSGEITLRVNKE